MSLRLLLTQCLIFALCSAFPPDTSSKPTNNSCIFKPSTPGSCFSLPFPQPALHQRFADPSLLLHDNIYYSLATSSNGKNVQVARSSPSDSILNTTWTYLSHDALPGPFPSWIDQDRAAVWAPDITRLPGGKWLMYFSASTGSNHCIGSARSSAITGPYTPDSAPFICLHPHLSAPAGGAIDAATFIDPKDGSRYVVYRQSHIDGNSSSVMIQQVNKTDGVTKLGEPKTLVTNELKCDTITTEAPNMVYALGQYILFFSTGNFKDHYTVSMATSDSPTGSFTRRSSQVLGRGKPWGTNQESDCEVGGQTLDRPNGDDADGFVNPGGLSAVVRSDCMLDVAFHAYDAPVPPATNRRLYTARFELEEKQGELGVKMTYVNNGKEYIVNGL